MHSLCWAFDVTRRHQPTASNNITCDCLQLLFDCLSTPVIVVSHCHSFQHSEWQIEGQTEAHIDILPCNSFQHSARHTLFIRRCSDLIRGGCAPLSRCHRMRIARSATPPIITSGCQLNGSESLHFLQSALLV